MVATTVSPVSMRTDGKRVVQAFIIADDTPAALPTTGENVRGMSADDVFAPFSILYIVGDADTKLYITNESGVFIPQ